MDSHSSPRKPQRDNWIPSETELYNGPDSTHQFCCSQPQQWLCYPWWENTIHGESWVIVSAHDHDNVITESVISSSYSLIYYMFVYELFHLTVVLQIINLYDEQIFSYSDY